MTTTLKSSTEEYLKIARNLGLEFAKDAAERDIAGGTPKIQRDDIRKSGLLKLFIPRKYGGYEQSWSTVLLITRELAKVDASLAHLYGYHNLIVATFSNFGTLEQKEYYYTEIAKNDYFLGNASNSLDYGLKGIEKEQQYVINGKKSFSSGSPDSDLLFITWNDEEESDVKYSAIIPSSRKGVNINDDWDNIGQRQTGSGTVSFDNVNVEIEEVIDRTNDAPFCTIGPFLAQSILANLFVGSALGALEEAKNYTNTVSRAWINADVNSASRDPYILKKYGELWTKIKATIALGDKTALEIDKIFEKGFRITAEERGIVAIDTAGFNVFSGNVALEVTSTIFELMGARASASKYQFDRFWRNVRTHTLHNPANYKLKNIGNWFLNDESPEISVYS